MRSEKLNLFSTRQAIVTLVTGLVSLGVALLLTNVPIGIAFIVAVYSTCIYFLQSNARAIMIALRVTENEKTRQEALLKDQVKRLQFNLSDTKEQAENLLCRNEALDRELTIAFEDQGKFEALFRAKAAQVEAMQIRNRNLNAEVNGHPPIKKVTTMADWQKLDPKIQLEQVRREREN